MRQIRFDIVSIFPEAFAIASTFSILKRAIDSGKVDFVLHDIRLFADGKHRVVDDSPYGGGAGMVMKPGPAIEAMRSVPAVGKKRLRIYFTPQGARLDQELVRRLAKYDQLIMMCGHYEGVDQRVRDSVIDMEVSIGDYVLTGGELPALVLCDAVSRLLDGVLGNEKSHLDESFENGLLEYPQYTRPAEYKGLRVPKVLLEGNHKKINEWREEQSKKKTMRVRPDLMKSV